MVLQESEILLVEDNPEDLELTLRALREHRLANRIHVARDGAEALAYLQQNGTPPRVVLLDLKLPKVSGLEVLEAIRHDGRLKTLPVVVLTSSDADADILKAYKAKANCYVKKPVMFQEFLNTVKLLDDFWLTVVRLPRDAA